MTRRVGIPTVYRNVRFRSRHEAAWAALFDRLAWPWSYEPTDLAGYIPDFLIAFERRPLLIEIKPLEEDMELAKSKLDVSGWDGDAAILVSAETKHVGAFREDGFWDGCVLGWCTACNKATLCSEGGRWECRHCGAGNRSIWWAYDAADAWAESKNLVQWRAAG